MINIDELLAPVSDAAPCGEDPWSTGVLSELETLAAGKPETQFSAAEDPDWPRLRQRALAVAAETKDLRVAAILSSTLLRTDGLAGFLDGVRLLHGYLENFWETVFPLLDESEGNDPYERINALSNLAAPLGADGDLLKVVSGLRALPLLSAPRSGRFSLTHYHAVREGTEWPADAGTAPTKALLDAAKQELGPDAVAAIAANAHAISDELKAIEQLFKDKAGPSSFPSFEAVQRELKHIFSWLDQAQESSAASSAQDSGNQGSFPASQGSSGGYEGGYSGGPSIGGEVRSRDDVVRALEAIISYYRKCEPSSPVPFLLMRAKRIVPMDFLQLMHELTPEARDKINLLIGEVEAAANQS
jgi:type VI secretion system protein ImpA